ncbi:hypothetical protein V9L05_18075 [Bernardetia sp. Wsw4-3y2]|uniref:hypothetical protein n=1 Tax=Bernardetia sp. Wsw4-3y2 TaxID=3127471 RepID=UPI0030CD9E14
MKTPKPRHKTKIDGVGSQSYSRVKKQTTTVNFTPSTFIDLPRIIDESIRIALVEMNHRISKRMLDFFYGKTYKELKNKPRLMFILTERLKEMSIKLDKFKQAETELETYGAKMIRNSKYNSVEKLISFYQGFATQLYEFIKTNKEIKQEDIALVVECKCCKKYLNLHAIKEFINYDSYRKIQYLIDKKNCHIKIVNRRETKRKFGRCKAHIQTIQHTLF